MRVLTTKSIVVVQSTLLTLRPNCFLPVAAKIPFASQRVVPSPTKALRTARVSRDGYMPNVFDLSHSLAYQQLRDETDEVPPCEEFNPQ